MRWHDVQDNLKCPGFVGYAASGVCLGGGDATPSTSINGKCDVLQVYGTWVSNSDRKESRGYRSPWTSGKAYECFI
jgi:hypothetical protein